MKLYVTHDIEDNCVLGVYSTEEKAWEAAEKDLLWKGVLPKDSNKEEIEEAISEYYSVAICLLDYEYDYE